MLTIIKIFEEDVSEQVKKTISQHINDNKLGYGLAGLTGLVTLAGLAALQKRKKRLPEPGQY